MLEPVCLTASCLLLPLASPRSASTKADCLSVSSLVAMSILFRIYLDRTMKSIIARILWLIFLQLSYLYFLLILTTTGGVFDEKIF
jgi:hypothetical protein